MPPIYIRKVNCPHSGWLSNMSAHKIVVDDIFWKTAESYFQSLRFAPDDVVRETIRIQKSPIAAKKVAKENGSRMVVKPMSEQDVENMRLTLRLKFRCNQIPLEDNLLRTGDRTIIEDCSGRRTESGAFWGAFELTNGLLYGRNMLGKLLMDLRNELKAKENK
jgi:type I restriction enzyme S subunit